MFATAKNIDIICWQMREQLPHLASPMKKELGKLTDNLKEALTTREQVKPLLDRMLPDVFNFRVKAIKWLAGEGEIDFSGVMDEILPQLEDLRLNPRLEILAENILFAVRCNKRVVNALIDSGNFSEEKFASGAVELPEITYDHFLATLAYGVPDDEAAQTIVDWVNASLYIELIILSAAIIHDEKLNVSEKVINELSFLIADAAQEYMAIAMESGLLKPPSERQASLSDQVDESFLQEQKYLAESGINDFAKNF
jgi:hypothetical protein